MVQRIQGFSNLSKSVGNMTQPPNLWRKLHPALRIWSFHADLPEEVQKQSCPGPPEGLQLSSQQGSIFAVKNDLVWWVLGSVRTHNSSVKTDMVPFVFCFQRYYYCYHNEDGFDWLCIEQSSTNKHETTCNNTQWHNALGTVAQHSGDFGELAKCQDFVKHPEKSWANIRNHITYIHINSY